jgi:hypothetical protein
MQPRGQLWFALEGVCQDFRSYSGLTEQEALEILVIVLNNLLNEQKTALEAVSTSRGQSDANRPMDASGD